MSVISFYTDRGTSAAACCNFAGQGNLCNSRMGRMKSKLMAGRTGGKLYLLGKMLSFFYGLFLCGRLKFYLGRCFFDIETI